jgi:excisionase family DNA binding protein
MGENSVQRKDEKMEIMPDMTLARWAQQGITYMTVAQLAEYLQVSLPRIRRWERNGKLASRRVGKRIIFQMRELEPLIPLIWRWLGRSPQTQA